MDPGLITYAIAFAAGAISFASPCVLALVPGYLSFVSGVGFDELGSRSRQVIWPTASFVVGFSLVFTALGASAGLLGRSLTEHQDALNLVAGSMLVLLGVGILVLPWLGVLQSDRRRLPRNRPASLLGASLTGGAFAVGWTPCIGPVLGGILTVAAPTGSPAFGASLLLVYSLGLGLPFLATGLFFTRTLSAFRWIRRRWRLVNASAAVIMVGLGVLVASGQLTLITQRLSGIGFSGI